MRRIAIWISMLGLLLSLVGCVSNLEDEDREEKRVGVVNHINDSMAATQQAFYYENDGVIFRGVSEKSDANKFSEGQLIAAGAKNVYYKEAGKVYVETSEGEKILLSETDEICYAMESAQGRDLLFIGEELYLLNEVDPADQQRYTLKDHAYACLGQDFIYWYRLEAGNRATLCRTDFYKKETEELFLLDYIGTAKPYMSWYEGKLYFYYGYRIYCYDSKKEEMIVVKECAEGDQCIFWNGKAYLNRLSEAENYFEVIDLKNAKVLYTEVGNVQGLSVGRNGVAYQLNENLIVERFEEKKSFFIGKNETIFEVVLMDDVILAKTLEEYRLYSYEGKLIKKY